MQLIANKRLAIDSQRENRFPLDAFWEMGIYLRAKTTGFVACVQIQFSHRWVNWESICPALGIYCLVVGRLESLLVSNSPPPFEAGSGLTKDPSRIDRLVPRLL
ncbi:hypothetical protein Pan181_33050 [Aeoliella mucimassa]|uniref:Uncharacterized protein n=1 Tax=Aeoliella mucimassa TaxID=2527972 RepID=A0A518AQT8_9BACT|nr:hypothetical protein Pan181_33050 [Aeoliella mucimassa]